MADFTVEATTLPVVDNDGWRPLHRVLDMVPGSVLLSDPEMPTLILTVNAISESGAEQFAVMLLATAGAEVVSTSVTPAT
jgi:hypothetical protein